VRAELEAGGQRDVATHDGAIRRPEREAEHGAALVELDRIGVRDPPDRRGRRLVPQLYGAVLIWTRR
jgi:hypothetical protein